MSGLSNFFVDPDSLPTGGYGYVQLLFLTCVYGYVLYRASGMIADGSEMLMLVLSPGLVGGLVLPVMGAVPDGAIVLFSGLGPDAAEQLKVGVGTLAGSTIMLLTLPWAACAWMGRVDLSADGKRANYKAGLTPGRSIMQQMTTTGYQTSPLVAPAAKIMLLTALTYLVIQGPSFAISGASANDDPSVAGKEKWWALTGFLLAAAFFVAYAAYCVLSADAQERQKERIVEARKSAVATKLLSIASLLQIELGQQAEKEAAAELAATGSGRRQASARLLVDAESGSTRSGGPSAPGDVAGVASRHVLKRVFDKFDTDGSGELNRGELKAMLASLDIPVTGDVLDGLLRTIGGEDKRIQYHEFEALITTCVEDNGKGGAAKAGGAGSGRGLRRAGTAGSLQQAASAEDEEGDEDGDDEDGSEEEEESEHAHLTPLAIKLRAFATLAVGVVMVTLFSDPMVDVLSTLGNRLNVSPFYVSFIVTPIVSNASELLSGVMQARKKRKANMDVTYSQFLGAATMNNTFCLAIFLILVFAKGLAWEFSAEVLTILAVEAAVVALVLSSTRNNHTTPLWKALMAALLYPASLLMVYVLENVVGWD